MWPLSSSVRPVVLRWAKATRVRRKFETARSETPGKIGFGLPAQSASVGKSVRQRTSVDVVSSQRGPEPAACGSVGWAVAFGPNYSLKRIDQSLRD
jgi:hypothetical protein